jgi:hypothetical protein
MAQEGYLSCGSIGAFVIPALLVLAVWRKHTKIVGKEVLMGFPGNGFTVAGNSTT